MDYVKTELSKSLCVNGIYTIHYFEYTKDFAYSGEFHDFWEIVYADKKSVVITAGSKELTLQSGQMYIHKPNEFHKIRCDGANAANSIVISFDCSCPELMSAAGVVINCSANDKKLMGLIISEAMQAFSNPLGSPYTTVMEKSEESNFGCEQVISHSLELLLISLIRSNMLHRHTEEIPKDSLLIKICDFLENSVEQKLCFDDILKQFNTSASVIKRLFHSEMGCGVMEYFLRLKIDAAKRLIRENEYNFTEIALRLGFNNSQYFTTSFRRVSGMTPSEYEKSVKSNFA